MIDDAIAQRVRASFDKQGLMRHLGAELREIDRGRVTIALAWRPELTQQHGYFHAGATGAIADSAGGYAALTMFPDDADVLTVEYKLNLLAPAEGERLEAIGAVVKAGRTLTVCTLEVFGVRGDQRTLVATGQQTLFCVRPR
ncbi:MAG TPA: PaaI family thioesterase [Kofleriaceae bacterium]|jgi:uncharacterized protein (TIGR00369 family)